MLIIFSVNDQKITHDLKGQLVAGSVDIVQAAFKFDSSWDELDKIVVFTSSACPKSVPVQFADEAFYIPKDVLKPGKLYVSVVGFGLDGRKKTTQKRDIMQAITAQPSIGTFTLTGAGAVEAGTKVAAAAYSGATLNAGSYQYGPATGVTATNWKVERITNAATTQVTTADAASLTAGSDNNSGSGFIIGDAGGDNAVSSLKYRVTATHGAGVTAKDNLGADSSPVVAIAAGSKTKDTAAYTPFRNVFYGTSADKPALDSAAIRALGKTGKAYAASTLTINVPVGAQRVAIACIATAKGVTKVINETAMNADVTSTFTKSTVSVEGANGYAAKDYNVWVFEPAVAYGNAAVLKVTLG